MSVMICLFVVALLAGFVDAIAGGGGLLTVPALLLAGIDPRYALGTNKGQGVFGTATSLGKFWSSPLLDRRRAALSFPPALLGAVVGALLVSGIARQVLAPLIMILLAAVAILMSTQRPPAVALPPRDRPMWLAIAVAFTLAAYDGFFGPGTGTFLIMAYAYIWRDRLDAASANAKVVNFASNLAAMLTFLAKGLILWHYALPMAAGQIIGGYLGAHMTIRVGRPLVRYAVVLVSIGLIIRLGWALFRGG